MRRAFPCVWVGLSLWVLLLTACGGDDPTGSDDGDVTPDVDGDYEAGSLCRDDEIGCEAEVAVICADGSWQVVEDCGENGEVCEEGRCVPFGADGDGQPDGDLATDGDGESEADGDADDTACECGPQAGPCCNGCFFLTGSCAPDDPQALSGICDDGVCAVETCRDGYELRQGVCEEEADGDLDGSADGDLDGEGTENVEAEEEWVPECTGGPCCAGGEWREAGRSCLSDQDNFDCTDDVCAEDHSCQHEIQDGFCLIDAVCYATTDNQPFNECSTCSPDDAWDAWTPQADDTACNSFAGVCRSGICEISCAGENGSACDLGKPDQWGYCLDGGCHFGGAVATYPEHSDAVLTVAFSPTLPLLASGSADDSLRLLSLNNGDARVITPFKGDVHDLAFSTTATHIAVAHNGGEVSIWDVLTQQNVRSFSAHTTAVRAILYTVDGSQLLTGGDDFSVKRWNAASGTDPLHTYTRLDQRYVRALALNPAGDAFAAGGCTDTNIIGICEKSGIHFYDLDDDSHLGLKNDIGDFVYGVAYAPDASRLVAAARDHKLYGWQLPESTLLYSPEKHPGNVHDVAVSVDSRFVATAGSNGLIGLWKAVDGTPIAFLSGHSDGVNTVAFSPDGQLLASGSDDNTLRLWDISALAAIAGLE